MKNLVRMLLAGVLLAGTAWAQDAGTPVDVEAAKANRAKVKAQPKWLSGPKSDYPEAERAAGHHGEVRIEGVIGTDGKLHGAVMAAKTGAPVLDGIALAAAEGASFEPAKDAAGNPIAVWVVIPYEYYSHKSTEPGGGLTHYGCRQFVIDMDWWRATFPEAKWEDHELYTMIVGLGFIARSGAGQMNVEVLRRDLESIRRRWPEAIEKCRAKPEKRFADVLQPEGKMIDALSKGRR